MNKTILGMLFIAVLIAAALLGGVYLFLKDKANLTEISDFDSCAKAGYSIMESFPRVCRTPDNRSFTENIGNILEKNDLIRVESLKPNDEIKSPLVITGEARGNWFFEASFPIRLVDSTGNTLVSGIAQAQEEWMTTDFVPFKAELKFIKSPTQKGELILSKDNPSGLPEHDDELRIPVIFANWAE